MGTRIESLRLLVGDRIETVGIAGVGHADGVIWDTFRLAKGGLEKGTADVSNGGGQEFLSGPAESAADATHPLRALYEQFALEDEALVPGPAAQPLEVLLGRLEALLL